MRKAKLAALACLSLLALARFALAEMEAVPPEMKFREDPAAKMGDVGLFRDYRFESDGRRYDARILIPQNYDPQKPVGLLFGFHGYSSKLLTEPKFDALWDMEYYAEEEYLINVSLSMAYQPALGGWQYGWDHSPKGLNNPDVKAVDTLLRLMKSSYNVNEDRVFANGSSNGAGFCLTIMHNLPGVFAAVAPENPVMGYQVPTAQNPTAVFIFGGIWDEYGTGESVKRLAGEMAGSGVEIRPHVWNQGHRARRIPDTFVAPALTWEDETMEFFRTHPRGHQAYGYKPAESAEPFIDNFDVEKSVPSSDHWRVENYNADGIAGDLGGYHFVVKNHELVDTGATSETLQGGLCRTTFFTQPNPIVHVECTVHDVGRSLNLTPLWIGDSHGRVVALRIADGKAAWTRYATHHEFMLNPPPAGPEINRYNYRDGFDLSVNSDPALPSADLAAQTAQPITVNMEFNGDTAHFIVAAEGQPGFEGDLKLPADGARQFGFGVQGINPVVGFDNVSVAIPDAAAAAGATTPTAAN